MFLVDLREPWELNQTFKLKPANIEVGAVKWSRDPTLLASAVRLPLTIHSR